MKKISVIFLFVLGLLSLNSCDNTDTLEITSFHAQSFDVKGANADVKIHFDLVVGVINKGPEINLSNVDAVISYKGEKAIKFHSDNIKVDARSEKIYTLPVVGTIVDNYNPFLLLGLLNSKTFGEDLKLDIQAETKLFSFLKPQKVVFNDIPVMDLLKPAKK